MMRSTTQQTGANDISALLTAFNRQSIRWQQPDKISAEWLALGRKIAWHVSHREWLQAMAGYEQAIDMAEAAGDVAAAALSHYGHGIALLQVNRLAPARQAFQAAVELAEQVGHHSLAAKGHFLLATFYLDEGDFGRAIQAQSRALALIDDQQEWELAILIRRNRATTYWSTAQFVAAQADLTQALALAQAAYDTNQILAIQTDLQVLAGFTDPTGRSPEMFAHLLDQATRQGQSELVGELKLHQALALAEQGELAAALTLADTGRRAALAATDFRRYLRYLSACLIMAAIQEKMNDRPGMLETLLTCKGALEQTLGSEAGQMVTIFLDRLPDRWGAEALQEALEIYRERAREKAQFDRQQQF